MTNARDKANIPALNFSSTGIDDNANSAVITLTNAEDMLVGTATDRTSNLSQSSGNVQIENGLIFSSASASIDNQIMTYRTNSLVFATSATERMRINATGLGIGTSSPAAGLEVSNSSGIKISRSGYSQYMQLYPANNNVPTILGLGGNGIHIGTTTSTGIHVDGSDNVGIGTTSPVSKVNIEATKTTALSSMNDFLTLGLTVDDNTTYNEGVGGGIAFRGKRQSGGQQTVYGAIVGTKIDNSSDGYNGHLRFFTNNNSNGVPTEHLRITSAGLVGIGETAPLGKLHVKKSDTSASVSSSADALVVEDNSENGISILSGTGTFGNIFFGDSGSNTIGRLVYNHSDNSMRFITNNSEHLRINSSGKALFNTTISNHGMVASSGTDTSGNNACYGLIRSGYRSSIGISSTGNMTLKTQDAEIRVEDSAGNNTVVSPHNFDWIPNGASEDLAWSYYSRKGDEENDFDNTKYISADITKVIRKVENLTGEKLIYTGTGSTDDGLTVSQNIIQDLITRIESLEAEVTALKNQP
jgi:hypothetical protein